LRPVTPPESFEKQHNYEILLLFHNKPQYIVVRN